MNRRDFSQKVSGFWAALLAGKMAYADETAPPNGEAPMNLVAPTLGGKQFWADEYFFHDWHIQRNCFTGHCRLLDGKDFRHAWGSFEHCRQKLDAIRAERQLPPMSGRAVIVLHGLFRTDTSMAGMATFLKEQGKFAAFNISYPSTRGTVGDHAKMLAKIIESLEGIAEINFVAHSLGNLVIRHYLADHTDATDKCPDARIKRIVMLAPPNNGAQMAEALLTNQLGSLVAGKSGQQIARDWAKLSESLAIPTCEFGIIAGGRNQQRGYNPLLNGDNDLIVSVDTARLPGAADFVVLPVIHTTMMNNPQVQQCTLRFLEHGHFFSAETRQPIPREAVPVPAGGDQ